MYYKITNINSKVFKKLYALRTKELQIEIDNRKAVDEKVGLDYSKFIGHHGQQNFGRTTQYVGFAFNDPAKVDTKIWKRDKKHAEAFVANTRTKLGREMNQFLLNGLQSSFYLDVFDVFGFDRLGKFTFPFVEIVGAVILVFLGDNQEPSDPGVIEITKREFEELLKNQTLKSNV